MNLTIDARLVGSLLASQFPRWAELCIEPVQPGGWDNKTFRLGEHLLVRLPNAQAYAEQVEKEHRWLPILAPSLPLRIPTPLALGAPGCGYPWSWAVYRWLDGHTASHESLADTPEFATGLAQFLVALQQINPSGGPAPGQHNFYRGGSLMTYDKETRQAIAALEGRFDTRRATEVWEAALATSWRQPPVWIHGDVTASNLLVHDG